MTFRERIVREDYVMGNQIADGWSKKEEEILLNFVGTLNFHEIAKKLKKRSVGAIETKVERMGIGNTQAQSGMITVHRLSTILNISDKSIYGWIRKYEFPIIKMNLRDENARKSNFVSIAAFWTWAEQHKERINWHKVEPRVLIPEPEWVKEKRKQDIHKKPFRKIWNEKEERRLWELYYHKGLQQKEIGDIMGVTTNAVEKRLKKLREIKFAEQTKASSPSITHSEQPIVQVEQKSLTTINKTKTTFTDKDYKEMIEHENKTKNQRGLSG